MIIGNGMLARAFAAHYAHDPAVLVFASGVADSTAADPAAFAREHELFARAAGAHAGTLLYFSTCAVAQVDGDTPYLQHKRAMEARVLRHPGGLVLRLPQVVGPAGNPHTLANFLARHIRDGTRFRVWARAERNLVDVEDVARIAAVLVDRAGPPGVLTIAGCEWLAMPALVALFERVLGRKALCDVEDRGAPLQVDAPEAAAAARTLGIDLGKGSTERVVRRYHGGGGR